MEASAADILEAHTIRFLEMAFRTDRHETVSHPDGYGLRKGVCGDTVEMFLSVNRSVVQHVGFRMDGCMHTNACANALAELAEGRTVAAAWNITPQHLADFLQTLPTDHFHCAELVTGAFYLALADFQARQRDGWKRLYGRR